MRVCSIHVRSVRVCSIRVSVQYRAVSCSIVQYRASGVSVQYPRVRIRGHAAWSGHGTHGKLASKLGCRVDLFGKLAYKCAASICFLLLFDSSRDTR